jgi:hypothetical protein
MFVTSIRIFRRLNSTITSNVSKKIEKDCKKTSERIKLYKKIIAEKKKKGEYISLTNDIEFIIYSIKF